MACKEHSHHDSYVVEVPRPQPLPRHVTFYVFIEYRVK